LGLFQLLWETFSHALTRRENQLRSQRNITKSQNSQKKSQDVQQPPKPRVSVIKNAALSSSSSASSSSDDDAQASRNPQQV